VNKDGVPYVEIQTNRTTVDFSPEEITAMIISNLKRLAETYLNRTVTHAVITVPSYYNPAQRQVISQSSSKAGLDILRIYDESIAAGITFEVDTPRRGKGLENCEECNFVSYHLEESAYEIVLTSVDQGVFNTLSMVNSKTLGENAFHKGSSSSGLEVPSGRISTSGRLLEQVYPKAAQSSLHELKANLPFQTIAPVKNFSKKPDLPRKTSIGSLLPATGSR
jgi:hypothetical protein